MQSGEIPDDAITASSSYDDESVGPANGRSVSFDHFCAPEDTQKGKVFVRQSNQIFSSVGPPSLDSPGIKKAV